jgi:hypothetical protein
MKFGVWTVFLLCGGLLFLANRVTAQSNRWQTEIYDNQWLSGEPTVRRSDGIIGFEWGNRAPSGGVAVDFFSIRWTTTIFLNENSRIRFSVRADDGIRVLVDGQTVLYAWEGQAKAGGAADKWLSAGNHTIVVEYHEHSGNAYAFFDYMAVETDADRPDLIPTVTPSVPLPTSTPVPFVTDTPRPFAMSTVVPFMTNSPLLTATQRLNQLVPTIRPTQTTPQPVAPTRPVSSCDLTPQPICAYYQSKIKLMRS